MGIKVLLADDSAAIKKVVQLCLQDFGVDLKTVGSGKEVLDLAKSFKPDIALIDVMLPHKPGFEVAGEIKKDPALQKTPVVMLWSNFMEFDEKKFKSCGAEAKLEKPFEAKDLRELVKKLVPKAQTSPLSQFVEIPNLDFKMPSADSSISKTNISAESQSTRSFSLSELTSVPHPAPAEPETEWVRKDLSKFKVILDEGTEENTVSFQYDESQLKDISSIMKAEVGTGHGEPQQQVASAAAPVPAASVSAAPSALPELPKIENPSPAPQVDPAQVKILLEQQVTEIVKKEVKEALEKAIWKIVPDMATQLIKDEINRLTSEN